MPYGRRITAQSGRKSKFSFEANTDVVGDIRLEKNPADGICNGCLCSCELTSDHVPPQGAGNRGKWKYQSYFNYMSHPEFTKQFTQNGLSWKTVCRSCHDKIGRFDTAISDLYSRLKAQYKVRGRPYLPISVRPSAIIRGVLMHFLSAKSYHNRIITDHLFANLLDNDACVIPQESHFYLFPFMQKQIRVFNGLGLPFHAGKTALVHYIKIFPLAMLWSDIQLPGDENLLDWSCWFNEKPELEVEIQFPAMMPIDDEFPEQYSFGSGLQLLGRGGVESVIAWPRK